LLFNLLNICLKYSSNLIQHRGQKREKTDAMKDNQETDKYFPLFLKIAGGFLIILFIYPFITNHFFPDWTKSGTFGATFETLNSFFSGLALAGVLVTILIQRTELKNQRIQLSLQRNEIKVTRKEILLNWTTSLVYSQITRFEKSLSELIIRRHSGISVKGNDAILYLSENENRVYQPFYKSEEEYDLEMKTALIALLKIYAPNISEIEKFSHNISKSVDVLKRLIYKTDLEIEELNDLKNLFFVNIGYLNMSVIERIVEVTKHQYKYLEIQDYKDNNLKIKSFLHADLFLKPIAEFYNLKLTEKNFKENKLKWMHRLVLLEKVDQDQQRV
jgi:hypothetical protein